MSRSAYSYDCEDLQLYRQAVDKAMKGKRGQQAFRDLLQALDGMPVKELISDSFSSEYGVCSLGALAVFRRVLMFDLELISGEFDLLGVDRHKVGERLNIAPSMAAEVMFENDEGGYYNETPEQRWSRMRQWVVQNIE